MGLLSSNGASCHFQWTSLNFDRTSLDRDGGDANDDRLGRRDASLSMSDSGKELQSFSVESQSLRRWVSLTRIAAYGELPAYSAPSNRSSFYKPFDDASSATRHPDQLKAHS